MRLQGKRDKQEHETYIWVKEITLNKKITQKLAASLSELKEIMYIDHRVLSLQHSQTKDKNITQKRVKWQK